jgi:arylsulfatase A-like enzyme
VEKPKRTLTRRHFLKGAGLAGASLLGVAGCGRDDQNVQRHPTRSAPGNQNMNVILVILDSLRKDHVRAYGDDRIHTPTLDSVAEEGLRFTRAHPDAMPTIPARRAIHTGMRTFPISPPHYGWKPIPVQQATLAEILRGAGYSTFLVTDTYHQFLMNFGRGFGAYQRIRGQERDLYKDPSTISEEEMREHYIILGKGNKARQYLANVQGRESEEDWFAPKVFLGAMDMLEEARRREPFFLVADCYDPHEPWDPPKKYVDLYDEGYEGKEPLNDNYGPDDYLTDRQLIRMRALYSGEITMADHWLGNFLQKAHEYKLMQNTLLIVISDHGHALGEHGYTGKPPYALWSELTDIVFFMRHPEGKRAGDTSDHFVSTHDVAPTILGMLDIEPPAPMDGQNLSVLFDEEEPEKREHFTAGYKNYVWASDVRHVMFSRNDGSGARLYDAQSDPRQERDLADDDPDTVGRMFEEYVVRDAKGTLPT